METLPGGTRCRGPMPAFPGSASAQTRPGATPAARPGTDLLAFAQQAVGPCLHRAQQRVLHHAQHDAAARLCPAGFGSAPLSSALRLPARLGSAPLGGGGRAGAAPPAARPSPPGRTRGRRGRGAGTVRGQRERRRCGVKCGGRREV